jgi:hypothetical protein
VVDTAAPKRAARRAEQNTPFRVLARGGYAANGLVHLIIGVIVIAIARGGSGEGDQAGALMSIAAAPLGFALLWILAVLLWALGAWHALDGVLARSRGGDLKGDAKKWGRRVSEWGQAAIFIALGLIAAYVALGARIDGEAAAEGASRGLLQIPGGPVILALIGLGIGIGGISFIVMGILRSFHKRMDIPGGPVGAGVTALGVVGFIAKGVALAIVGVLLLVAAVKVDATEAGGLDGAIDALLALPAGPWLAGLVGAGFIAYGVFCFFRARYAKL